MSVLALIPNNKNQYRRYPLKQGATALSLEGIPVSDELVVNCSITTTYGRHRIYIKQIFRRDNFIKITIAAVDDVVLGEFSGDIIADFTTLKLIPYTRFVSGNLTLGTLEAVQATTTTLNFEDAATTEIEESAIFCYTPPAVTSIRDVKGSEIRGFVNFGLLTNLTKTTNIVAKNSNFTATYPEAVLNTSDKSTFFNNCPNPVIKSINTVVPFSPVAGTTTVNDGNIYIAGVRPVVFYGDQQQLSGEDTSGVVSILTEGLNLDKLCSLKHNLIPPLDITGFTLESSKNNYYNKPALSNVAKPAEYPYNIPDRQCSSFRQALLPEYYFWPQFVGLSYYADWSLLNPSAPTIVDVVSGRTTLAVSFKPPKNAGITDIASYQYRLLSADLKTPGAWVSRSPLSSTSPIVISDLVENLTVGVQLRATTSEGAVGMASYAAVASTLANHYYVHGNYYSDDQLLATGSVLYLTQYDAAVASDVSFTEGLYTISTIGSGVVTKVYTYDHQYPHANYWSDASTLQNGALLYVQQYGALPATYTNFIEGLYTITTDIAGLVTKVYTYDHPYPHNSYWSNSETLVNGSILYVGQYSSTAASNIGFIEDGVVVATNTNGVVTVSYTYTRLYQHGGYWSDDVVLGYGSVLYTGQHNSTPAANKTFIEGDYTITTNTVGAVTKVYTYDHPYPHNNYWSSVQVLADGSILYTGQHSSLVAANINFIEGNYTITTNGSGVVTKAFAYNHQYPHPFPYISGTIYYSNDEVLVDGSTLYTEIRSTIKAASVTFIEGLNSITTNNSGVVAIAYAYNFNYPHNNYWSSSLTLENGSTLYTGQHNNILATDVSFVEGLYTITTDIAGLVTKVYTYDHQYSYDLYYSDDAPLVDGVSILYTSRYGSTIAANKSFGDVYSTVTTNAFGVVTVSYTYTHQYSHGVDTSYWSDDQTLTDGSSILYTGQHNNTPAAGVSFVDAGYAVTTDINGVVARDLVYTHPYPHGDYWGDSQVLVTNVSVLYLGQHDTAVASDVSFVEGLFTITTDSVYGRVTKVYTYDHQYSHGDYYSDDQTLTTLVSILYTGQHNNTPAAGVSFVEGLYTINTNGSGIVAKSYTYTHQHSHPEPYVSGTLYYSDAATLANGSALYTGQHNNTVAADVNFIEGDYTITTNIAGVVTRRYTYNNNYTHGTATTYWSIDLTLANGSILYTGQYNNTPAAIVNFTEGLFDIITNGSGVVSKSYTYTFSNPHGGYYSSDVTLENGVSFLYVGIHDNTPARGANFTEGLYKITTDTVGRVAKAFAYNHNFPHGVATIYYSDTEVLLGGQTLYTEQHNNTPAALANFIEGLHTITTNGSGVVTKAYTYTHLYPHGAYWSDTQTLLTGSILYTGQHNNTLASGANFIEGDYTITTNGSGLVTKTLTYPYNHNYQHGAGTIYYSDDLTLVNGVSVLYTGPHSNAPASNVSFVEGLYTINTNGSGLVTKDYTYTHQYSHPEPYVSGTLYYSDVATLVNGSILYTQQHANFKAANVTFAEALTTINTNYAGIVAITYRYNHPFSYAGGASDPAAALDIYYNDFPDELLFWSDDYPLVVGSLLYTEQHNNTPASGQYVFIFGDFLVVSVDGAITSVVYKPILHPYRYGDSSYYYSDAATPTSGDIAYSGPYDNSHPDPDSTYTIGVNTVTIGVEGAVAIVYAHPYPYNSGTYWSDDEQLLVGSILYTGQHNNTLAVNKTFFYGPYTINTNGSGIVAKSYTYTHQYPHGDYYSDDQTLTTLVSILYTERHNTTLAADANFIEGLFTITTDVNGLVTKTPIIYHQYTFGTGTVYYSDTSTLTQDVTILYSAPYTNTLAVSVSFIGAGYRIKTGANAVVIFKQYINHPYPHGVSPRYWSDIPSAEIGGLLFTEQHNDTRATSVSFTDGLYTITTNANGVIATKTYTITHPNAYGTTTIYYSDDLPLVNGSILYKEQHTALLALNVSFELGLFTYTTDSVYGRVTKAYTYNNYPYGIYWSSDQSLTVNTSILYTGQHNNEIAADTDFERNEYRITTNGLGVVTTYSHIDHPHPQGAYWCDNESLFDAIIDDLTGYATIVPRVLYTGQHTNTLASDIPPFEVFFAGSDLYISQGTDQPFFPTADGGSGYMISTDGSGVVSRSYIEHQYNYDYDTLQLYWGDVIALVSTNPLYTGKHTNVRVAAGYYEITGQGIGGYGTYAVVVDADGVMSAVTLINHSVELYSYNYNPTSLYWVDVRQPILPGTPIYTGQYTNTHPPAGYVRLYAYSIDYTSIILDNYVFIGTDGEVSRLTQETPHPHGDYYSDDLPLVNGSMLYIAADSATGYLAADIPPFEESGNMISTDANGVVTVTPI